MEALNKQKSRRIIKSIIALSMTALLFTSCGKDTENEIVSTDSTTNPLIYGVSTTTSDYWGSVKAQNICPQGSYRTEDMAFNMPGSAYGAQISGNLSTGYTTGTVSQTYIGMNSGTKDLLFISQVTNGYTVSYNVTVSLCSYTDPYSGTEYIGTSASLSNFYIPYMTLSNSTNCTTGQILDGWLSFYSQNYGGNVPTQFSTISSTCY